MKKDIPLTPRPERFNDGYLRACGNLSWYDLVAGIPSLVFLVTGWKSNGRENACLHSWSSFAGTGPGDFLCILSKVSIHGHMYRSLRETGVCVLNFPSRDIYDRCIRTIGFKDFDADEITAAGLTAEPASRVNAPRIRECFLNLECEYLWEHPLTAGGEEAVVALRAVNLCMDSDRFDAASQGRYGASGYLFQIDQATDPGTGRTSPVNAGILTPLEPVPWITR